MTNKSEEEDKTNLDEEMTANEDDASSDNLFGTHIHLLTDHLDQMIDRLTDALRPAVSKFIDKYFESNPNQNNDSTPQPADSFVLPITAKPAAEPIDQMKQSAEPEEEEQQEDSSATESCNDSEQYQQPASSQQQRDMSLQAMYGQLNNLYTID